MSILQQMDIVNLTNELKAVVVSVNFKLQEQEKKIRDLTATVDLLKRDKLFLFIKR